MLAPELNNRVDQLLCFAPLMRVEVADIPRWMFAEFVRALGERGIWLKGEQRAVDAQLSGGRRDALPRAGCAAGCRVNAGASQAK